MVIHLVDAVRRGVAFNSGLPSPVPSVSNASLPFGGPEAPSGRDVLDAVRLPLIVLAADRSIVQVNSAASRMLESGDCIAAASDRLHCIDGDSNAALDDALREVIAGRIERRFIPVRRAAGAFVPSIVSRVRRRGASDPRNRRLALLAISGLSDSMPDPDVISAAFRLTPAEGRIAAAVGLGQTPQEYATSRQLKVSTIRSQLTSVYRKTGAGSQAHLARLIFPLTLF